MAASVLENGVYFIQNIGTGTVIDLRDGSSADGTVVQGFEKHELSDVWVPAQLWIITKVAGDDNLYTIQNANSRTYLDLRDSANGTAVLGYAATGSDYQKWVITRGTYKGTAYVISNKATGTYADLYIGRSGNGTPVEGWIGSNSGPDTNNEHQLWLIVRA